MARAYVFNNEDYIPYGTTASEVAILKDCKDKLVIGYGGNDNVTINGGSNNNIGLVQDVATDYTSFLGYVEEFVNAKIITIQHDETYIKYRPLGSGNGTLIINNSTGNTALMGNGSNKYTVNSGSDNWVRAGNGSNSFIINGGEKNVALAGYGANKFYINDGIYNMVAVDTSTNYGSRKSNYVDITGGSNHVVYLEYGHDTVKVEKNAGDYMYIISGAGNDTITVSAGNHHTIWADYAEYADGTQPAYLAVDGVNGNNKVSISQSNNNSIITGKGNDAVTLKQTTGNTAKDLGGKDTFALTSANENTISLGSGNDTVTLTNSSQNKIYLEADANTVNINSGLDNTIYAGKGSATAKYDSKQKAYVTVYAGDKINVNGGTNATVDLSLGRAHIVNIGKNASATNVLYSDMTTALNNTVNINGSNSNTVQAQGDVVNVNSGKNNIVNAVAGSNTIKLAGTANTVYTQGGANSINLDGGKVVVDSRAKVKEYTYNNLKSADGDASTNTITVTGTGANVSLSNSGTNIVTLKSGTLHQIDLKGTSAVQTVNLSGVNSSNIATGAQNDVVNFVSGTSNTVETGAGNDTVAIMGGSKNSVMLGSGDDTVTVLKNGSAAIYGESGHNTYKIMGGNNNTINVGSDSDTIELTGGSGTIINLAQGSEHEIKAGTKISVTLNMNGSSNNSALVLGNSGNKININAGSKNTIEAGSGANTIVVNGGDNNQVTTTAADDTSASTDRVTVTGGSSTLNLGAGNDSVMLSGGSAVITAGDQKDAKGKAISNNNNINIDVASSGNNISLGSGKDTVLIKSFVKTNPDSKRSAVETNNTINAGDGDNTITIIKANGNTVTTGKGKDTVSVEGSHNIIEAGLGADKITINGGSDNTVVAGTGNDAIVLHWTQGSTVTLDLQDYDTKDKDSITINKAKSTDFSFAYNNLNNILSLTDTAGGRISIVLGSAMDEVTNFTGIKFADKILSKAQIQDLQYVTTNITSGDNNYYWNKEDEKSAYVFSGSDWQTTISVGNSSILDFSAYGDGYTHTLTKLATDEAEDGSFEVKIFDAQGELIGSAEIDAYYTAPVVLFADKSYSSVDIIKELYGTDKVIVADAKHSTLDEIGVNNKYIYNYASSAVVKLGGIDNNGYGNHVFTGEGNDKLYINHASTDTMLGLRETAYLLRNTAYLGNGNDIVEITNINSESIDTEAGNDKVTIKGGNCGTIDLGAGNDTISVSNIDCTSPDSYGKAFNVYGEAGNDVINLTNIKTQGGEIYGDEGNDKIYLSGTDNSGCYISGDEGDDSIYVQGKATGTTILGGLGNDTYDITWTNGDRITINNYASSVDKGVYQGINSIQEKDKLIIRKAKSSDFTYHYSAQSDTMIMEHSTAGSITVTNWSANQFTTLQFADGTKKVADITEKSQKDITVISYATYPEGIVDGSDNTTAHRYILQGYGGDYTFRNLNYNATLDFSAFADDSYAVSYEKSEDNLLIKFTTTMYEYDYTTTYTLENYFNGSSLGYLILNVAGFEGTQKVSVYFDYPYDEGVLTPNYSYTATDKNDKLVFNGTNSQVKYIDLGKGDDEIVLNNAQDVHVYSEYGTNKITINGGKVTLGYRDSASSGKDTYIINWQSGTEVKFYGLTHDTYNDIVINYASKADFSLEYSVDDEYGYAKSVKLVNNKNGGSISFGYDTYYDMPSFTFSSTKESLTAVDILKYFQSEFAIGVAEGTKSNDKASVGSSMYYFGYAGNDTIMVSGKENKVYAGDGNDIITVAKSTATDYNDSTWVYGENGNDTITATGGAYVKLYGGAGNDSITVDDSTEFYVRGGDGDDKIVIKNASKGSCQAYGDAGNDTIILENVAPVTTTENEYATFEANGKDGNDKFYIKGIYNSKIHLNGGKGNDYFEVSGLAEHTRLYGAQGNDTYVINWVNGDDIEVRNDSDGEWNYETNTYTSNQENDSLTIKKASFKDFTYTYFSDTDTMQLDNKVSGNIEITCWTANKLAKITFADGAKTFNQIQQQAIITQSSSSSMNTLSSVAAAETAFADTGVTYADLVEPVSGSNNIVLSTSNK